MMQYRFDSTEQLLKFIINSPEMQEWEVMTCRFSTTSGLNMDLNTSIADPSGKASFTKLKVLIPTIDNFYKSIIENNYSELNFEMKFALDKDFKQTFDTHDEYVGFYLNTHSDNITIVANTSHLERSRNSGLLPISNWDLYFANIHQTWCKKTIQQEI